MPAAHWWCWVGGLAMFGKGIGSVSAETCARLLLSQLRALKHAHRAGIQPHYGQLEALFDTADVVERHLDAEASVRPLPTCACGRPGARTTADGRMVCIDCAVQL